MNFMLCHYLVQTINAKAQFLVVDTWGYKQENSQFYSGLVGDLQRGRAEIGGIY